tara:strand:- start:1357 stop:1875 length:519 start_codon:yes stop_codon:yes gene_type:complete
MKEFKNLIILGPLVYALHHFEEHIIFNFREWRLKYFLDNNPLSTEEVLLRLISILLVMVLVHTVKNNKGSAHIVLFFLMTTQVMNALFHVFFSIYFNDLSPGTITAVLLYLPTNYLIIKAAFNEGYIENKIELLMIILAALIIFLLFELIGPDVIGYCLILMPIYYIWMNKT